MLLLVLHLIFQNRYKFSFNFYPVKGVLLWSQRGLFSYGNSLPWEIVTNQSNLQWLYYMKLLQGALDTSLTHTSKLTSTSKILSFFQTSGKPIAMTSTFPGQRGLPASKYLLIVARRSRRPGNRRGFLRRRNRSKQLRWLVSKIQTTCCKFMLLWLVQEAGTIGSRVTLSEQQEIQELFYTSGMKAYELFLTLKMIGCMRNEKIPADWNEFEKAAFILWATLFCSAKYGRFFLQCDPKTKVLTNRPLFWIAVRTLLSTHVWRKYIGTMFQ